MKPTLLTKGNIVPNPNASKKEKDRIKNMVSIDYITDFISDRIPDLSGKVKIKPTKPGDRVIVLKSGTGTGKSTVIPPTLYNLFMDRTKKSIAVTQPRVLTSIDIPTGLPEFYDYLEMGVNLGYNTGSYKRIPTDKGVIFMTTGVLLQQMNVMNSIQFMNKYSFILVDEVHDRDINIDITLYMIKKFLQEFYEDPKCPMIILMSATFKQETFIEYFDCSPDNAITVTGATFPIQDNFLKYDSSDFIKKVISIAEEIHIKNLKDITDNSLYRDIIIFVNGAGPAKKIIEALHLFNANVLSGNNIQKYIDDKLSDEKPPETKPSESKSSEKKIGGGNYYVAPIDLSSMSFGLAGSEYQKLFSAIEDIKVPVFKMNNGKLDIFSIKEMVVPSRRIIVSTPVAETGVTIETLKYCIDTGLVTSVEFNPDYGTKLLLAKPVTRGMATQRRGRVGRKSPGNWYACYTKETYDKLQEDQFAEILSTDITLLLLNIIIKECDTKLEKNDEELSKIPQNLFKINDFESDRYYFIENYKKLNTASIDFLESPSAQSLSYSFEKLYVLGFIDNDYFPTAIGYYGNKLRKISLENIKMIMSGYAHGANIIDLITMSVLLESKDLCARKFQPVNPFNIDDKHYQFYNKVIIGDSFINLLFLWYMFSDLLDSLLKHKIKKSNDINEIKIREWCSERKLDYDSILKVIADRDDIINSFISVGLNPYYNGLGIDYVDYHLLNIIKNNLDDGLHEIKKIKKCIYEGYKLNLCVWHNTYKKHFLHNKNVPIMIRSQIMSRMGDDAIQRNPNFLILSNIIFKKGFTGEYEFASGGYVSIMDSFVNVDLGLVSS